MSTITRAEGTPSSSYISLGLASLYKRFQVTWIDNFKENTLGVLSIYYFVQGIFLLITASWLTAAISLFTAGFAAATRREIQKFTDLKGLKKEDIKVLRHIYQNNLHFELNNKNLTQKINKLNQEVKDFRAQNQRLIKSIDTLDQEVKQFRLENQKYIQQNTKYEQLNLQYKKQLNNQQQQINQLSKESENYRLLNKEYSNHLNNQQQQINQFSKEHKEQLSALSNNLTIMKETLSGYEELCKELTSNTVEQKEATRKLTKLKNRTEEINQLLEQDVSLVTQALQEIRECETTQLQVVREQLQEHQKLKIEIESLKRVSAQLEEHNVELRKVVEELKDATAKNSQSAQQAQGLVATLFAMFAWRSTPPTSSKQHKPPVYIPKEPLALKG